MLHEAPSAAQAVTYLDASDYYVVPERIFLVQSAFADRAGPFTDPEPLSDDLGVLVSIGLHRLSKLRLTVALAVAYGGEDAAVDLKVTYAAQFLMRDTVAPDVVEDLWEHVARDLAVKLLYPYIRQAVSDLTEKWRGDKLYLPFVPLPLEFPDDEEFKVPLPADESQVSLLDALEAG